MAIPKQSFYNTTKLVAGVIAEHNPKTHIRSFAAEEAGIKFGRAIMQGTEENEAKIFAATGAVFRGVAGYSPWASDLDNSQFSQYDEVPCIESGVVMVHVEEAVTPSSTVRIRHTADGSKVAGSFCTTSDAGKTTVLTGAEYRSSGASGTAVKLYLDPVFTTTND